MQEVAAAPGITWRSPHPDDDNAVLVESQTQQEGDHPFFYRVTYTYKFLDETELLPWDRPATFSFSGSLASVPAFQYYSGTSPTDNTTKKIIVNSAGDPLQGLDKDAGEFTVVIQKNIPPPFLYEKAMEYVGAVNSDAYAGAEPRQWKCQSITASRKAETVPPAQGATDSKPQKVFYWDTTMTLAYRVDTWDLITWDVGFNEIKDGKRVKIYAGSDPVSEPVALLNGRAKTPGQPPEALTFRVYKALPFITNFPEIPGSPSGYEYPTWTNFLGTAQPDQPIL